MLPLHVLTVVVTVVLPALAETDCPDGWVEARSVGLGCLLADISTQDMNLTSAQAVCQSYGEAGRLLEITSMEQISFLQNFLTEVEVEWGTPDYGPGFIWWWLGLNDLQVEGEFVWPVAGEATLTYWDVDYEEPLPGKHEGQTGGDGDGVDGGDGGQIILDHCRPGAPEELCHDEVSDIQLVMGNLLL